MFCSISGSPPEEPVVAKTSGLLFERRLIEKALAETGECPVTKQPLSRDDLLPVKTNKVIKPRSGAATSIPGLLSLFHNEWDALMLETATLRESLDARNKELATSLYQYDAACRVIARLSAERDEARAAAAAAPAAGAKRPGDAMDVDGGAKAPKSGLSDALAAAITETAAELSKGRKKRAVSAELATPAALAALALTETLPLHKPSSPGIAALALDAATGRLASGGADKTVVVYDRRAGTKLAELKGHTKEVSAVAFARGGAALLSGSADKTARLWAAEDGGRAGFRCAATFADHAGALTAVTVHPCGDVGATASADGTWALYDLVGGACALHAAPAPGAAPLHAAAFHPDGLILGTGGGDGVVRVWDVKSGGAAAAFEGHAGGAVAALAFSENGYHLATGGADGVKLWDLRKLKCVATLAPFADAAGGPAVAALAFDASGQYLAAGGAHAAVFAAKQEWAQLAALEPPGGKKRVTALLWGPDARFLAAAASGDHNLRIYTAPPQ